MSRIAIQATDIVVVPGPAFEAYDEDGPYTDWSTFIVYRPMAGNGPARTLGITYPRHAEVEAGAMRKRIIAHGSINPSKWTVGDPWQAYHGGMTLEERLAPFGPEWQYEERERAGGVA